MTLARSSPLDLEVIPMRLPDADPELLHHDPLAPEGIPLMLIPGEPSQLMVKLGNPGEQPLNVTLEFRGNLPQAWYSCERENSQISPGISQDIIIEFQAPDDFFEAFLALRENSSLRINYSGRLQVYGAMPGTVSQLIDVADINFYVRPQSRYLDFLPQIYREVDFVGRFLKIIEETFNPDVQMMASLFAYLDPLTAPQSMLPFLAHWVGWEWQSYLSLDQQRSLIRHALEIYRWRGTRRGLRLYLHLATGLPLDDRVEREEDKHIAILETFSQGLVLDHSILGQDALLGGGQPFHFRVHLQPDTPGSVDEALVRQVIDQQKPAFCTYELQID
ncbi:MULTISPECIES: phage tail protein [unclassified Roseofilum]|uniref:phage tail protein n=1 Tax=unclassified Roseofilum TaxID=2620099 RepID=UPI000E8CABA4|nr:MULTISPECIES: phage tail protein [unclassified Roseofilum]MBP0009952.1 phage tail protein [Roseofilum sp. Belize Diploria]MBP0034066.1 phage tail protein [Roseofilum sp. Belize BBD 4]HBQ99267.1 phage tail protein [Cyanobacteria bacterium UBA11691]